MVRILVLILIFLWSIESSAQYYDNGQDPFSIDWKKIETNHFKLLFPAKAIAEGERYADYLERIYNTGGATLSHKPRKVPVIIHNQNVQSNGEVAWAPRRMNLYAVSPQFGYSEMYSKHLALHEFRHVVQIDKLNQSSTRFLYYLFGEQAIGGVLGWHIPLWFFEGDAVVYETGASNSGRGRSADFNMKLKAQVSTDGIYSYPKAQFGSYKDFVPNHYELGYQLISRANDKFGMGLWPLVLNKVAKNPVHINSFSKGIKKFTRLNEKSLYFDLMSDIKLENVKDEGTSKFSKKEPFCNYYEPYWVGNKVISYKTSFKKLPGFVLSDSTGFEKHLFSPGSIINNTYSYNDSLLVWNEYKGTRWANKNYAKIVKYDLNTQKKSYLTNKTRAYSSVLSPDNTQILSVEVNDSLKWAITIRDAMNGQLKDRFEIHDAQPVQPSWSPDMTNIVFIQIGDNGISLGILDIKSRKTNIIIKDAFYNLSKPTHWGNFILIKATYKNASNILKYTIGTEQWQTLTHDKYGVGTYDFSDSTLVYTSYTHKGYKLNYVHVANNGGNIIEGPELYNSQEAAFCAKAEHKVDFSSIDTVFNVKDYSRLGGLLNLHSWAPLGIEIQNMEIGTGATLMTQNLLSTFSGTGAYQYNRVEKSHKYSADFTYKGFYPIINSNISRTFKHDSVRDQDNTAYAVKYSDLAFNTTISLPLNFDRGMWYRRIQPAVAYGYSTLIPSENNSVQLLSQSNHNYYLQLYAMNLRQTSKCDVQPRWGQILNLAYMRSFNLENRGKLASAEFTMHLPGFMLNHGVSIYAGYQYKEMGNQYFNDRVNYPYGYTELHNDEIKSVHFNYHMPLLYPDLNIFELAYIKRIKTNAFYQYNDFTYKGSSIILQSAGVDVSANMHLLRFVFPCEMGVRYARRIDFNDNYYQFLFSFIF